MSLPWSVSDVTCHMPPSSIPQMMSTGHTRAPEWPTRQASGRKVFLPLVGSRTTQGPNPLQHAPGLQSFPPFRKYCSLLPTSQGSQDRRGEGFLILHSWQGHVTGSCDRVTWNTGWQADLPSTGCRKLSNRMLLQSFLSDLYFLKHCHCQSPSSRGRRQAANEQLAVNYPLPNHLHLISGAGKAGTHATSREKVGTEQRRETAPYKALQRQKVP